MASSQDIVGGRRHVRKGANFTRLFAALNTWHSWINQDWNYARFFLQESTELYGLTKYFDSILYKPMVLQVRP